MGKHGQTLSVCASAAAVLAACLATACWRPMGVTDPAALWSLEVRNEASDRVRVAIGFRIPGISVSWDPDPYKNVIVLDSGESRRFDAGSSLTIDSSEDNDEVLFLDRVEFYAPEADTPYRRYVYPSYHRCVRGRDETHCVHERADGTMERLFVKSPERPFYLELDKQDGDLARLVITFVPDAEPSAADGG